MPKEAIGKIGGGMFIVILVILFFAARGNSNEMMYITLLFVFIVISLFTYGFWSSVAKGEGFGQYMGKHNLQHQQISNPNYHFGSFRNYKTNPNKKVHICAPPKMGGARLAIYTIPLEERPLERNPSVRSQHQPLERQPSSHKRHHYHKRGHSIRRPPQESNEEEIKVEVYCDSDKAQELNEIHVPIPTNPSSQT